jgi:acyl carrier protein
MMMNKNDVTKTVMELINNSLVDKIIIKPADLLKEDLGMDSIGFIELGTGLEEKYRIDISDDELESLVSVEQVINTVLTKPAYAE